MGKRGLFRELNRGGQVSKGFSFGLTSGVITTLGMIVGLDSATHSITAVVSGVISIAVADAFSDSFGVHVSEEAENNHSDREIWIATASTFATKFLFALSFIAPFLLFNESKAILVCIAWGLLLIGAYSIYLARREKKRIISVVSEHLLIALIVIALTHLVGDFINSYFSR